MEGDFQVTSAPPSLALNTCTIDISTTPNEVTVTISGELDMADADRVGEVLADVATADWPIVCVDLAELTFADSSAVRAILLGARAAADHGVAFQLVNPHDAVRRLLEVTGLVDALTVVDEPLDQAGPNSQ